MSDSLVHFTVSKQETKNKRANCSFVPSFTYCVAWRFGPGSIEVTRNTHYIFRETYMPYILYSCIDELLLFQKDYDQIQTKGVVQNSEFRLQLRSRKYR